MDDAAKYAQSKGVAVVVSAGNDGQNACDYTPPHTAELITVAASNASDQRINIPGNWGNNYGPCVDIFAPVHNGRGTSEAAPFVTGVAALYLQLFPTAGASSVASVASHFIGKATVNVLSRESFSVYYIELGPQVRSPARIIDVVAEMFGWCHRRYGQSALGYGMSRVYQEAPSPAVESYVPASGGESLVSASINSLLRP